MIVKMIEINCGYFGQRFASEKKHYKQKRNNQKKT